MSEEGSAFFLSLRNDHCKIINRIRFGDDLNHFLPFTYLLCGFHIFVFSMGTFFQRKSYAELQDINCIKAEMLDCLGVVW